ncbi:glycoside hydrolase superfamily [Obelidium mucronatum]|nr:glycoside hydrolase superfamily [Obelidium mucronatum]
MFPDSQGNLVSSGKGDDSYWISIMNGPVRQKYQHIRTILSIGGYTGGVHFSSVAGDAGLRQKFVKNIHSFLDTNGFDGVDIDWEYPGGGGIPCNEVSANDVSNFATLLSMLRTELGAVASRYIQGGRNYATEYAKHVNFMGIMTYDLYGPWVANADFNAPLTNEPQDPNGSSLNVQNSIQSYISEGVSPSQLVGGLAFYGRSWSVASQGSANGLFQPCANSPSPSGSCPALRGDFHDIGECDPCGSCGTSGAWTYFALRGGNGKQSNAPLASGSTSVSNGWSYQYFTSAASATVFSPSYNGISNLFVAFDDARSIQAKASWMRGVGLGGALVWEIGGDFQGELGSAARAGWSS